MIPDAILQAVTVALEWLFDLVPVVSWPEWLTGTSSSSLHGVFSWAGASMAPAAAFVNLPLLITVTGFLFSLRLIVLAFGFTLRLAMIVRGAG
jgi:hypothetical protein